MGYYCLYARAIADLPYFKGGGTLNIGLLHGPFGPVEMLVFYSRNSRSIKQREFYIWISLHVIVPCLVSANNFSVVNNVALVYYRRNSTYMSEAQRSALNALLFRTGDQSRDIALVLATNRPGDLDSAITDRIDEVLEFPLPGEEERYKLLKLYLKKYLSDDNGSTSDSKWGPVFSTRRKPQKITVKGLSEDVVREAAKMTDGFSGREIAKLMAGVQAAVYGRPDCSLDSELFREVVDYKVSEHHQRMMLAVEGALPAFG